MATVQTPMRPNPFATDATRAAVDGWEPPSSVIVATDGSPTSDAAVVVGRKLAQQTRQDPELFTVFERTRFYDSRIAAGLSDLEADLASKQAWWHEIEEQRRRVAPTAKRWPVTFAEGNPARAIAGFALVHPNPIVITGLGEHGMFERTIGRELALDVIRQSVAPVLAVHADQMTLPRTALVALDFTPASIEAARLALHLLGERGTLYVVRVRPVEPEEVDAALWEMPAEEAERLLFTGMRYALDAPPGVLLEPVMLHGDPATSILNFAVEQDVDLIACGMHRYSTLERLLVGSVSTRILRGASCSVLVAPPRPRDGGRR